MTSCLPRGAGRRMRSGFVRCALVVAATALSTAAFAQGWSVRTEGQGGACVAATPRWNVEPRARTPLLDEYKADPAVFEPVWRKWLGMFAGSTGIPLDEVERIEFVGLDRTNVGVRNYQATLRSGERVPGDDNFGSLYLCRPGDAAFHRRCLQVFQVALDCLDVAQGVSVERHLDFDHNRNGASRTGRELRLSSMVRVPQPEMQTLLASYEKAREERPAKLAAAEAARQEAARRAEVAAVAASAARAEQRKAVLERSAIGTTMFCESSADWLVEVGTPITTVSFKCDLIADSLRLREMLDRGWDIASESRMPQQTIVGTTAYQVSLRMKKLR